MALTSATLHHNSALANGLRFSGEEAMAIADARYRGSGQESYFRFHLCEHCSPWLTLDAAQTWIGESHPHPMGFISDCRPADG
jgi:hypothetical protein